MNARRRILIVSSVLLCMLSQRVQANPNHLEPIPPYYFLDIDDTSRNYHQAVFTSLIGKGWLPALWMIERPSVSREYAIIVHPSGYDPNDPRPLESKQKRWVIVYVAPKEKIWMYRKVGDGMLRLDIRPTKDVERHHVLITEDFAKAVYEAWLNTLQLTRYAEDGSRGRDGTILEFCCGDLFGETWSPETGLPSMLADLGRKLAALTQSNEKDRKPLLAEAESLARKIAKEAEAEQMKLFGKKMSRLGTDGRPAIFPGI